MYKPRHLQNTYHLISNGLYETLTKTRETDPLEQPAVPCTTITPKKILRCMVPFSDFHHVCGLLWHGFCGSPSHPHIAVFHSNGFCPRCTRRVWYNVPILILYSLSWKNKSVKVVGYTFLVRHFTEKEHLYYWRLEYTVRTWLLRYRLCRYTVKNVFDQLWDAL